jgi:hypothetical protein
VGWEALAVKILAMIPEAAIFPSILTVANALISAAVAWVISRLVLRENTARELLSEALAVQALEDPALISSRGKEELCGWIERVRSANTKPLFPLFKTLSDKDLDLLRPLLLQLAKEDIVRILARNDGLTSESVRFLEGAVASGVGIW